MISVLLFPQVSPTGITLKNPPDVYKNLSEFVAAHKSKLMYPIGSVQVDAPLRVAHSYSIFVTEREREREREECVCALCDALAAFPSGDASTNSDTCAAAAVGYEWLIFWLPRRNCNRFSCCSRPDADWIQGGTGTKLYVFILLVLAAECFVPFILFIV
jgi:hypothetical protein